MDIELWKSLARKHIESGKMSDREWDELLCAALRASESYGLDAFDEAVQKAYEASK